MLVCLSRNRKVPAYRKHEQLNSTRPADWLLVRVLVRRVVLVSVLIRERLVLRMAPLLDFVLKSTNTLALLRATWKEGQILSPAKVYPMHTSRKVSSETACGIPMSVPLFSPTPHDRLLPPSLASLQIRGKLQNKQKINNPKKKRQHTTTNSTCICHQTKGGIEEVVHSSKV